RQRRRRDESGQPVADGDLSEQGAGAQDRSDRGAIGTLYEALDIGIASVTRQKRGGHQHEDEGREKDSNRRDERSPEAGDRVTNEGRGDHHGARADHPDRNRDEKLPRIEPAVFSHEPLLEEGHDHKATAERERAGLRKKSRSFPRVEADATGASCANTGTAVICSAAGGRRRNKSP